MLALLCGITLLRQLPAGWHKVELSKSLSVVLPELAVPFDYTPDRPKLAKDEDLKYWAFVDGKTSFVIGLSTFTDAARADTPPDQILGNAVRGALDGLKGSSVKTQRDTLFNGWPAIDFAIAGPDLSGVSRCFMVGKTMYQLLMVYPTAKGRPDGAEAYLSSLALSPMPPEGPLKAPGPIFQIFTPAGAQCSIRMPATPKPYVTPAVDGSTAAFTQYIAEYGNRVYMLCYLKAGGKAPGKIIKDVIGQLLLAFAGKQIGDVNPVKDGSSDFVSIAFSRPDGDSGRADISVINGVAYALVMLYPPGHAGSPDIDTFFSSFKVSN